MSFQRSGKTPSPEGYRNLGKSRSCQHSGILQDCFHRAGALESLQRFALQAFQRSGKCRQELADRFVLQAFKRQNGTALVGGETVSSVTTKHYCVYYRYTFFILEFSAIFHEKTPNRAFDDGDTHDWTDKYCGYNTLILHVIFYITQKTYTKLFS